MAGCPTVGRHDKTASEMLAAVQWKPIVFSPVALVVWICLLAWWISAIDRKHTGSLVGSDSVVGKIIKGMALAAVFGGAIYLSTQASVPDPLPGAALGWTLLFHIERAAAILGAIGIVLLIGWRALSKEFPIKFGNVEYAEKAASEAEEASESLEQRIRWLEAAAGIREPPALEDDL